MFMNNYAFIDGQNLFKGIQRLGWTLDYKKFLIHLREKYKVSTAYYFIGYIPEYQWLYDMLNGYGYKIIHKEVLTLADGNKKGNVDAELVLQAMIDYDSYYQAIIVSGDGDYSCLVKYLLENNKLKIVIAPNLDNSSILIRRACNGRFTYLDEFKNKLEYKKEGETP